MITPKRKRAPDRPIWAWDVEATDWDQVRCVVAVSDAGDVKRFSGPDALLDMFAFMRSVEGVFAAHAGGIYDTLLLSDRMSEPWDEVTVTGSSVLCAKLDKLRVRDTYRWWLSGLRKVSEYVDKQEGNTGAWIKKDVDRARIADLSDAETLDYCEHDAMILLKGIKIARAYMAGHGVERATWTSGSSALALLEQLEPLSWRALRAMRLPLLDAVTATECVRGARVDHWAHGRVEGVYCYDFKSAYPAAYMDAPTGIGAMPVAGNANLNGQVTLCRWVWPWRDRIAPVTDQLSAAAYGPCEAWCVSEEIDLLEACGVRVNRVRGWAPLTMAPIGQTFARTLYAEKERGSFFAKVFLNSYHGKTSENPIKDRVTSLYPEDHAVFGGQATPEHVECIGIGAHSYFRWEWAQVDRAGYCMPHVQPLTAAHILGRTRARLMARILDVSRRGGRVFYCDTDSIFCDLPPEKMGDLGNDLGQLAFEGGPYSGWILGPKMYLLSDATGPKKGALKGAPWRALADGVLDLNVFRQARGGERGRDLRADFFAAVAKGEAKIQLEGITSWTKGAKVGAWGAARAERTIRPQMRAKRWRAPHDWSALSSAEMCCARNPNEG